MQPQSQGVQGMIPPQAVAAAVRRGSPPTGIFQQNPLASNVTPGSAPYDPSTAPTPPPGSAATNPMMPPQPDPQAGMDQPQNGMPGDTQPMSEAQMILNVLQDRLAHHSKITEKTVNTLSKMIEAGLPVSPQDQDQGSPASPPTA